MKTVLISNRNTRIVLITIVLLSVLPFIGCLTAEAQGWVMKSSVMKNALDKANEAMNIIHMDPGIPLEQCAYLIPKEPIYFNFQKIAAIPQGQHTYDVFYSGGYGYTTTAIPVTGYFEAGKYYTFDYKVTDNGRKIATQYRVSVSIIEETDEAIIAKAKKDLARDLALAKNYLAYSKANPNALEGTYKTKEGKLQKTITFMGNKFHLTESNASYDGTFLFNQETIILNPEVKQTGKQQENKEYRVREIWYYKLNGIELDIVENTNDFIGGMLFPIVHPKFYKTTDSEIPDYKNPENVKDSLIESTMNEINTIKDEKVDTVSASLESLEGTYKTKDGKKQITFTGNRFQLSVPVPLYGHFIYDGTFIYDGETISINNEFAKLGKGKAAKLKAELVLSYQINDGLLDIFDIKKGKLIDFLGQYYKSSE